jgi:cysteine-rich repeat protein
MRTTSVASLFLALAGCVGLGSGDQEVGGGGGSGSSSASGGGGARGAIFTTTVNGDRVNENIYAAKTDVYLDGGPRGNAPSGAAALDEGDYYFQVTNPSGKDLLSTDPIECRRIHISASGVIDTVYTGPGCQHASGVDEDYASLGAITVQLAPYLDTTNNGGEYKVWVTPVSAYSPSEERTHGFVHSESKTDNFKVRADVTPPPETPPDAMPPPDDMPPPPDDMPPGDAPCCGDGHVDAGEQCDDGNTSDGDGCSATCVIEVPHPEPPCDPDLSYSLAK